MCVEEMDDDQMTNNAVRIMQFAKAMLRESRPVLMPHNSDPVLLRIGIHTGPLVSGLVGSKMPKFTLFGVSTMAVYSWLPWLHNAVPFEHQCDPTQCQL